MATLARLPLPPPPSVVFPKLGSSRGGDQVTILLEEEFDRIDRVVFAPEGMSMAELMSFRHVPDIPTRFASMHNRGRIYVRAPPHEGGGAVQVWAFLAGRREPVRAGDFRYEVTTTLPPPPVALPTRLQMGVPVRNEFQRIAELEAEVAHQRGEIRRLQARVDELESARLLA